MPSPEVLAQVRNLSRQFTGEGSTVRALDNVDLSINPGEFLTVLGPSGCGKSTLLNILAGFDQQTSGAAEFEGAEIKGPSSRRGVVFQDTNALFPWMTVLGNVEYGLRSLPIRKSERRERALGALRLVRLEDFRDSFPRQLSGGMRQLVAIARVIVMDAALLLMDEPFAALDAITRQRMQEQLTRIWEETSSSIMFITHSIDEAIYLGDRVAIMSARPGQVRKIIEIDLPRPRNFTSPDFNQFRRLAMEVLAFSQQEQQS